MAKFGRPAITLYALATAIRMAPITIKKFFPDLDSLLFEILRRHITNIQEALYEIPHNAPNRAAAKRAAYIKFTRNGSGGLTTIHQLFIRDRNTLPLDLQKELEEWRASLGAMVGGNHADVALTLLDCEALQAPQIEAMLAAHAAIPFQPDVPEVDPYAVPPPPLPKQRPLPHKKPENPFIPLAAQLARPRAHARAGPH
jgi:AcrR family transcriptional regulator